jgi:hypothetical protein
LLSFISDFLILSGKLAMMLPKMARKTKNITPAMLEFGQPDTFGERFHPNARRRNTKHD